MWRFDGRPAAAELFLRTDNVEQYGDRMGRFRNVENELKLVLGGIDLQPDDGLIEFGCGTSEVPIHAATRCEEVIAVDISQQTLEFSKAKAEFTEVSSIAFANASFFSYVHDGEEVDRVVSKAALHHLPGFWSLPRDGYTM